MADCLHRRLETWHFKQDGKPAGMWSCIECGHKFVPLDLAQEKNAARYLWLRAQNWNDGLLAVVADPKDAIKLGYDCPSLDRLDEQIDAAMLAQRAVGAA